MKQLLFIVTIFLLFAGCKGPLSKPVAKSNNNNKEGVHNAVVEEVLQAGGYTYLNVSENKIKTWLAVPGMEISKGVKLAYSGGLEMTEFKSKELNRTFPSILFLEGVTLDSNPMVNEGLKKGINGSAVKPEKITATITPCEGCITIAKLLETKEKQAGKTVKIKGIIVKFNPQIMGKNWVHIQDGTDFKGAFDLTITTNSEVTVGETATFEGKISLKKDFGYGYFYDVLMEDGKLIK
jgi:hypothetical protein